MFDATFNLNFDDLMNEVDSNSVDAYYNYASVNFEEYENVDTDFFSVRVSL